MKASIYKLPSSSLGTGRWPLITGYCSLGLRLLLPCLGLLLLTTVTACRMLQTAADVPSRTVRAVRPGKKDKHTMDPVEVQQTLLRFADEYSMRMISAVDNLRHGTNALTPVEMLQTKIALGTEICSIASGPNAVASLLDMTVFVTVSRMSLEDYWQPRVFGESARPMIEYSRSAETEIWQLAGQVLALEQQTELRAAIEAWHRQNPMPESIVTTRALGFSSRVTATREAQEATSESVFSLLKVDPLSGMDPAVREITQTRLFAERALFVTQKMPMLLRWQTELLSVNTVEMPTVRQLVTNSTQIAASVDRFAAIAERLPGQFSAEREELVKALESQEKNLTPLVNEVRQTLTAGTDMSTSLNATLTTFDTVMKHFGVGETNNASTPKTNAEPFRIADYGQTAEKFEEAARQLTELLITLDRTFGSTNLSQLTGQITPAVQLAQAGSKRIVDYAFWKSILLIIALLLSALIYRVVSTRLAAANPKSSAVKASSL